MTEEKKEKVSVSDWKLIKRALGIIYEISPAILEYNIARALINAITPYIAIYMSALIVDELVGKRDINLLMIYVFITAAGTLLFNILENLFSKKANVLNKTFRVKFKGYLNNYKLNIDYSKFEDPKYNEMHSKIVGTMFMVNGGISSVVGLITTIADNIFSVIIAIVLIVTSVFQVNSKVSGYEISSVISLIILIGVIAGSILLTVNNSKIESKKEFDLFLNCATNRYIDYYHYNYMEDDKAAKDIHIFDQRKLIVDEIRDKARKPWMTILLDKSSLVQKYFGANTVVATFIGGFAYAFVGIELFPVQLASAMLQKVMLLS
jgi:ATP-binding cassette subfamily B protein